MKKVLLTGILTCCCLACSFAEKSGVFVRSPLDSYMQNIDDLRLVNSLWISPLIVTSKTFNVIKGSEKGMYSVILESLADESGMTVISVQGDKVVLTENGIYPHEKFLEQAKSVADSILVTRVQEYVDRDGSMIGSNQGASVGLQMSIYRLSDNKEVWRANYFYQDKPLSENLFRIRDVEKGWVSADSLYRKGVLLAVKDFAGKRLLAFEK